MQSIIPPLIAVIGSDGSGKSTVCEHLITVVEKYGAAERVHLGKQAGNVGRAVTKLPLMGKSLHKTIERNQVKTAKKLHGPVPALVITAFVARRLLRFRHMLACRRRGLIVLTDRYPQDQILALMMVRCFRLTLKVVVLSHGWQVRNVKHFTGWRATSPIWSSNSMLTLKLPARVNPTINGNRWRGRLP